MSALHTNAFLVLCPLPKVAVLSTRLGVPARPTGGTALAGSAGSGLGVGTAPHPSPASLRSALNDGLPGGEGAAVAVR